MSEYTSSVDRERLDHQIRAVEGLYLSPYNVQRIVFELITNYMVANDPRELGFDFVQRYDSDPAKSTIHVDIAYNWRKDVAVKRPAVFIERSAVKMDYPTIGQLSGTFDAPESEAEKLAQHGMGIKVSVVGTNLGFTEMLAEYVKQPLLYFRTQIERDFRMRRFRLDSISEPKNIVEPKDHFVIELNISTVFDEGWIIKGDHLKLKTVTKEIYDKVMSKPLT